MRPRRRQSVDLPAFQCAIAAHPHPPTGPGPPGSDQGDVDGFAVYRAITGPGSLFLPGIGSAHVTRGLRDGAALWREGRNRLRRCYLHIADARRRFRCPTRALSTTERARSLWTQASARKSLVGSRIRSAWWTGWQRRPNARSSSTPWLPRWSGTTSNSARSSRSFELSGRVWPRSFAPLQTICTRRES